MRKNVCKFFIAVLLILLVIALVACNGNKRTPSETPGGSMTSSDFEFENCEGGLEIVDYIGFGSDEVTIPAEFNNKTVVKIGQKAFENGYFSKLTIPNTIVEIDEDAFLGCNDLKTVDFLGNLNGWTSIKFKNLASNPLNANVGVKLLFKGDEVEDIEIPDNLSSIEPYAYSGLPTTTINIPSSVKSIGAYAFYGCNGPTTLIIPDTVDTIGEDAFGGIQTLQHLTIKGGNLSARAFENCSALTTLDIADDVTEIGEDAFAGCLNIETVKLPAVAIASVPKNNLAFVTVTGGAILNSAFENIVTLTEVTLEEGVSSIGDSAFEGCYSIEEIQLPESATSVGTKAFYNCKEISSFTLPKNVATVGELAFGNMDGLSSFTWNAANCEITPHAVGNEKFGVFYGSVSQIANAHYMNGTFVSIGPDCESIDDYTFTGLDIDTIFFDAQSKLRKIGEYAFAHCHTLRELSRRPNGIDIAETAFEDSTLLLNRYNGLNGQKLFSWDDFVFYDEGDGTYTLVGYDSSYIDSDGLQLPKQVTMNRVKMSDFYRIGAYAFAYRKDTVIKKTAAVLSIDENAFFGATGVILDENGEGSDENGIIYRYSDGNIYIKNVPSDLSGDIKLPYGLANIPENAFRGRSGITSIEIPETVNSIGSGAFSGCYKLVHIRNLSDVNVSSPALDGEVLTDKSSSFANTISDLGDGVSTYTVGDVVYLFTCPVDSDSVILSSYDSINALYSYLFYGNDTLKEIDIPGNVTIIGNHTFDNCTNLQTVTIGKGVKEIYTQAFSGCTNITRVNYLGDLKGWCEMTKDSTPLGKAKLFVNGDQEVTGNVTIPQGTTSIGSYSFYYLDGITSISIPDSVTSIGDYALSGCSSLKSITVAEGNTKYQSDSGILYKKSDKTIVYVPDAIEGVVTILDGCPAIGSNTFENRTSMTSVTIPDSVTSIGFYAFSGCKGLQSVTIGKGVTEIMQWAFNGCYSITRVNYLGDLKGWCEITNVSTPLGKAKLFVNGNQEVTGNVTIPQGTTTIGRYAFYYLDGITLISIPDSVTDIGRDAFYGCSSLKSITVAEGNTEYQSDRGILYEKSDKTIVYVPDAIDGEVVIIDGCTKIQDNAFSRRENIISITIPDSVTDIGRDAFYGCSSLKSITVAEGNTVYQSASGILYKKSNKAIAGVPKAIEGEIVILDGCPAIGSNTFENRTSMTSVTIPDSVTIIEMDAFNGCIGLQTVTIGKAVIQIESRAFSGCTSLATVNWNAESCERIGDNGNSSADIFGRCANIVTINIGADVKSIPENTFRFDNGENVKKINYSGDILEWFEIEFKGYGNPFKSATNAVFYVNNVEVTEITIPDDFEIASSNKIFVNNKIKVATLPASAIKCIKWDDLETLTITSGDIPNYAFYDSNSQTSFLPKLQTLTIGEGVTSVGANAFGGCTSLHTVYWNAISPEKVGVTVTTSQSQYGYEMKKAIFWGCDIKLVVIGDSVEKVLPFTFHERGTELRWFYDLIIEDVDVSKYAFYDTRASFVIPADLTCPSVFDTLFTEWRFTIYNMKYLREQNPYTSGEETDEKALYWHWNESTHMPDAWSKED